MAESSIRPPTRANFVWSLGRRKWEAEKVYQSKIFYTPVIPDIHWRLSMTETNGKVRVSLYSEGEPAFERVRAFVYAERMDAQDRMERKELQPIGPTHNFLLLSNPTRNELSFDAASDEVKGLDGSLVFACHILVWDENPKEYESEEEEEEAESLLEEDVTDDEEWDPCRCEPVPESQTHLCLPQQLFSEELSDFTVKVGDVSIPAHRLVLSLASSVLAKLCFQKGLSEANEGVWHVADAEEVVVRAFLRFVYTGNTGLLDRDQSIQLLAMADKYDVARLRQACETRLKKVVNAENLCEFAALAASANADWLLRHCAREAGRVGAVDKEAWHRLKASNPAAALEIAEGLIQLTSKATTEKDADESEAAPFF